MCRPEILVIIETAVNELNANVAANVNISADGAVIYSEKLGSHRHFYYRQQIRVYPNGEYGIVWLHSSGHLSVHDWESHFQHLEDAAIAAIRNKQSYYQADAECRADVAEAHYESMRMEA